MSFVHNKALLETFNINAYAFIVPYSRNLTRIFHKLFYFYGKVRYTVITIHALKKWLFNTAKRYEKEEK